MRLVDLDPHWISNPDGRTGIGILFLCPHCMEERVGIFFDVPLDGGPPEKDVKLWHRVCGNTFDTLTLTPSIDMSTNGHWHGFVTNGEVS